MLILAVFLGAVVQGFSGFAFSAVAGAILLQVQSPELAIPLMMICSLLIQLVGLARLRRSISLRASVPFLSGGAAGVLLAVIILDCIDPSLLRRLFGGALMLYAASTLMRRRLALPKGATRPFGRAAVGFAGGILGALTAMPGAVLAIWCDVQAMPKAAQRAVMQPFIAAMQGLALALLFVKAPALPGDLVQQLPWALPGLFAGTGIGLLLFGRATETTFRRAISLLLLLSGLALLR